MNFLFQMIIHILSSKTTQKYLLGPWVFVLKLRFVDHQFITTWSGICDIWFVSCYATIVKCQKSKMLKFPHFLETNIEQIDEYRTNRISYRIAQPIQFKNLQEDLGCLWKGGVDIESPVKQ